MGFGLEPVSWPDSEPGPSGAGLDASVAYHSSGTMDTRNKGHLSILLICILFQSTISLVLAPRHRSMYRDGIR